MEKTGVEYPFRDKEGAGGKLTVKDLKEVLNSLPDDYEVSFDSFCGLTFKEDLLIDHDKKAVSING